MNPHRLLFSAVAAVLSLLANLSAAHADVRLPGFFSDHMVLQQGSPIPIWGWAEPGEQVKVSLGETDVASVADESGQWRVLLPALKASKTPRVLSVRGNNSLELSDVLIGEVWLCSGQSNMEWAVRSSTNAAEEIAAADHPLIRHVKIAHRPSPKPLDDVSATWQVCSPETVGSFTAVGYFMGRDLVRELDVPIGLINSSWGGTRVEPWTPLGGFQKVDALQDIAQSVVGRTPGTPAFRDALEAHADALDQWVANARDALNSDTAVDASPAFPNQLVPFKSHQDPTMLYNGMIRALVGFPIRGAIWYQGESNQSEGMLYFEKKKALIQGWRERWEATTEGTGDFPFYFVQIAPFQYGGDDTTVLPQFWEAQAAVQKLPKTAMVVINDIATLNDIHPPNKQDVGARLALLALKHDYGRDEIVAHSPEVESSEPNDDSFVLHFRNTGGGLKTRDGKPPTHFELIGPGSRGFRPATAVIQGDTVVLRSDSVAKPTAFRFAWHRLAQPNLMGGTGLPVGAVRGGKEPDFSVLLDIERDHRLVYDLDLANLASDFSYTTDHSGDVTKFDRIGYLLELDSPATGPQAIFVSVDAFTDDAAKIGIPTATSGSHFQQRVEKMDVFSDVSGITERTSHDAGYVEFWPNNYGTNNKAAVPGASSRLYDFGDEPSQPRGGYGSMQVHDAAARTTLFAINHWGAAARADIGIGNSPGEHSDWTFQGNAAQYTKKRLRIYVRPVK